MNNQQHKLINFLQSRVASRGSRSAQAGFSLIELGVALLVISILVGGVLKSREMIEMSKLQRLEKDIHGLQASFDLYQDHYKNLPGDDPAANQRFIGHGSIENGNGNNRIDFSSDLSGGESQLFWQHLRAADLLKIGADNRRAPRNPFGGEIHLRENVYGMSGLALVATELSWEQAFALDQRQDDGKTGQGQIRVGIANQVLPTAPTQESGVVEVAFRLR